MAQITLYGSPISTFVRTARIALAEKGVSYDLKDVWVDSPEIQQRHPFQKIPVMRHGDFELYETFAIARYRYGRHRRHHRTWCLAFGFLALDL